MSIANREEQVPQIAVRLSTGSFSFAVERMFQQIGESYRARHATKMQKRTDIELAALPQYLRDDIGLGRLKHQKP